MLSRSTESLRQIRLAVALAVVLTAVMSPAAVGPGAALGRHLRQQQFWQD
jgi:hypothetical protein